MSKNMKSMAIMLLILAIALIFVEFSGWARRADVTIEIPQNAGISQVAEILKDEKLISNPTIFKVYSVLSGRTYYHGQFYIQKAGYVNIANTLSTPPSEQTINLTIFEGMELREIKAKITQVGLCSAEEFDKASDKSLYDYEFLKNLPERENILEGYLFPDTYNFSYSEGAQSIINKMLNNFQQKVVDKYGLDVKMQNKTLDEIVIMASLLEREVADKDELDVVSGVFYNRLNKLGESRGYLESCATVQYILKERKTVLSVADTKINSPYNTYMYEGLPIGPIASPGEAAIKAAIFPKSTDYLYFVAGGDGTHYFAKTYAEHQNNMRKAGL